MNKGKLRLLHLREQTEAVAETMATERERFQSLKTSVPRAVSSFNLFQTPVHIAKRMARLLIDRVGLESPILEPSAGLGRLWQALRTEGHQGSVTLVEQSKDCCRELYRMIEGFPTTLKQGDFLAMSPGNFAGPFAGVIMNPPFKRGRDIAHIRHALAQLDQGGRLVALCYGGPRQEKALKPLANYWEPLPPDTFRESGTRAGVVLLVIDKA